METTMTGCYGNQKITVLLRLLDERVEDPVIGWQVLVLLKQVIQLLLLRPYRLLQFFCGLFYNMRGFTTLHFRTRKRQKLLAWLRQSLGPKRKVEDLTSIWRDGTILCDVIEDGVPGSCSNEVRRLVCHTSIQHGQDLAARHLGVKPAFTCEDLQQVRFSSYLERRLVRYLVNIRRALLDLKGGRLILETDIFPETQLDLEPLTFDCVSGMGLKAAVQYCTASFYIYPQEVPTSKDFYITIQIEGSHGDFGEVEIKEICSTKKPFSSKFVVPSQRNHICNIPISYKPNSRYIQVTYVPQSIGTLDLCILMHGRHVKGSPFKITVDAAKLTNTPPKRRVRVLYRTVDFITEKMILTDDGKLQKLPNMEHILRHEMIYPFLDGGKHQDEPINNNKNNHGTELCNGESLTQISTINSDEEYVLTSKHKYLDIFKDRSRKLILMCKFLIKKSPHQILSSAEQIFDGRPVRLTDTTYKLIENALKSVKSPSNVANEHSTLLDGKPTVDSTNVQLRDSKYPCKEPSLNKNAKKHTKLYLQNSSVEVTDEWVHLNNDMHHISSGTTCMQTKIDNENEDDVKTLVHDSTEIKSEGMSSTISKTCVAEYYNQKIHTNMSNDSAGFTGRELETHVSIKFSNLTMSEEMLNSIDIDKEMHTNKGECHIVNVTDLNSDETKQHLKINEKFKLENSVQDKSVKSGGYNYDIKTKEISFDHLHQYCELCTNLNNDNCTHANDADIEPLLKQPSEKCSIADNQMQIQIKPMIGKNAETEKNKGISKICTEEASNANEIMRLDCLNSTASKTTQSQIQNNSPCISEVPVPKVELKTNDTSVLIEDDKRKVPYNIDDLSDCNNPTESNINVFLSAYPHSLEHIPESHKMEHSLENKKVHAKCNSSSSADKFNMKMISHMLPSSSLHDKYFDASSKTDTTLSDEFTLFTASKNIQSDNKLQDIALKSSSYTKLEAEVSDIESILALPSSQAILTLERDLETAKEIQSHTESGDNSIDNMSSKSTPPEEMSSTSTRTTDSSSDIQINYINNEGKEELTQEPNQGENHDIGDSDYASLHGSFKQSSQNRENDFTNENNKRVCNNASINIFTGLNSRTLQKEQSFHYHEDESYGSEDSASNESMGPAEKEIWGYTEDQTEKAEKIVSNKQHSFVDSTFISKSPRYFSRALSQDESLSIDTEEENKENNPLYKYVNLQSTLQTSSSVATLIPTENCTKRQEMPCDKCNTSIKETRQNVFKNTEKPEKCLTVSDIHSNCNNYMKPVTTFAKSNTQDDSNIVTHEVCGSKSEIFKLTVNCLVKNKQMSENKNIVHNTQRNETINDMSTETNTVSENFDNISNHESTIQDACKRTYRRSHIQDDRETVIHDVPQSKSEGTALNSLAMNTLISENKNTMNNNQISQTIKNNSTGSDTVSDKSNEEPTIKDYCIVNNLSIRMNTGLVDTGEFNVEGQNQTNDGQTSVTGLTSIAATNGIILNSFDINSMLTPADLNCISAETYQVVNNVIDTEIPDFLAVRDQYILSLLENSKPKDIIDKVKNIHDFETIANCDIVLNHEENETFPSMTCHPQFETCSSDMCLFKTLSDEDSTIIKSTTKSNNGDTFIKNSSNDTTIYIKGYDKWFTPTEYIESNHSEDNDAFLTFSNTSKAEHFNTISNTDIPSHKLHETEDSDKENRLTTGTDNLGGKNCHNWESELLDIKQTDRKKLVQLSTTKIKSTEKVNEEFLQTADYVDGFPATMGVTQRKQYWDQKLSSQSCNADIYGRDIHQTGKLQVHAKIWQNICKNSNLNPTNEETPSIHTTGIIKKYKPVFEANYPAEKMHSDIITKISVYSTDCKERKVSYWKKYWNNLMVNQVITQSVRENRTSLPAIVQLQVKESSCDKINHNESNEINFTAESTNIVPTANVDHNFVTNDISEDYNYQPEHMQQSDSHPYINEITKQGMNYITKQAICVKNTFENIPCKEKSVTESDMEHYRTLYDPNILKIPCEKDIYRAKLVHITEDGCKSPTPHSSFLQMRQNTCNIKNIHVSELNSQTQTSIEEITSQAISHSCMAHHLIETGDKNKEKACKHERDNRADSRSRFREAMKFFQTLEQKVSITTNKNKQHGTFPQTSRSLDLTDAEVENRGIIAWRSLPRLEQTERFVVEKCPTHINNKKNICRKCGKRKNKVSATSSAPTSNIENYIRSLKQNRHFEKFGGSELYPKKSIAERFHVKDLFKDITGDHNSLHGSGGLFREIPNQQAVLASLRSIDKKFVSIYNAAKLPNDPDIIPLVGQSQRYQSEYPSHHTTFSL